MKTILFLLVMLVSGCATAPRVKVGGSSAVGPVDPGTPARVESASTVATLPVPAGSVVEAVPAHAATAETKGIPASVRVTLATPSEFRLESHGEAATTGTVDTSVAVKRAELAQASADRSPLLWVAIVCGVAGVLALGLLKEWPIYGRALLAAAAVAGVAWKVAEVPWWAFAVVIVLAGLGVCFYKRGQWDANGNGIPDILEKPKT